MKKLIISAVLLAGMAASSYGQGTIQAGNIDNTDTVNSAATSNGSFWIDLDGTSGPGAPILMTSDSYPTLNYILMGGSTVGSMTVVASLINDPNMINGADGVYFDQNGTAYSVPGVPTGGTGVFQVFAWEGTQSTFAAAVANNNPAGSSVTFNNAVDIGAGPASATGMPAVVLEVVPEPGTFALAGLGVAALAMFRRRK